MADRIWHYTSESCVTPILSSGELRVSDWERKNKVKPPGLWLSRNPIWENSATKLVKENGIQRRLSLAEMHKDFGLIRFALPFNKAELCTWARYKHASNTPLEMYLNMEIVGLRDGANPQEWYVSFKNIPLSQCISCEKWNGTEWVNYTDLKKYSK